MSMNFLYFTMHFFSLSILIVGSYTQMSSQNGDSAPCVESGCMRTAWALVCEALFHVAVQRLLMSKGATPCIM